MNVVIGLLCSTLYEPTGYPRIEFLNLTQALEGFHRLTAGTGKYLTDDRYQREVQQPLTALIPNVDKGLTERLKSSLKYGNEYSQRSRFRELGDILRNSIGSDLVADPKKFSNRLCNTRNAFTHPGSDSHTAIDERDCTYANSGLQLALSLLILRHFGIPEARLANYKQHRLYRIFNYKRAW